MNLQTVRRFIPCVLLLFLLLLTACHNQDRENHIYDQAERAFSQEAYRTAEKFYKEYIRRFPAGTKRWEAWQRLVFITRNINRDSRAARKLLQTVYLEYKTHPRQALAVLTEGAELCRITRRPEEGISFLDKALNIKGLSDKDRWSLLVAKGSMALQMNHFTRAEASFAKALPLAFDDSSRNRTSYALGRSFLYKGAYDQARQILQQTFAAAPPGTLRARTGFALADIAEHEGRSTEALQILDSIKGQYPNPQILKIRRKNLKEKIHKNS